MYNRTMLYSLIAAALFTSGSLNAQTPKPQSDPAPNVDLSSERRELNEMREQMRDLSRKMADLSKKVGDVGPRAYAYRYIGSPDQGMVGLVLESDEHGLRVKAVTPGSAADKAGIRNRDLIVAIDGNSLVGDKRDQTVPSVSLGDLKVDQTLKLRVLRDGKTSDYTVKAEHRDPYNFAYAFSDDGDLGALAPLQGDLVPKEFGKHIREQTDKAMQNAQIYISGGERMRKSLGHLNFMTPWWGLNLVSLNPDLAGYFGADKGVLVLSADDEEFKQLKSGDVLQHIAGTKVERPEDAFRVLREQAPGSQVKVDVLRQHKTLALSLRAPESTGIFVPPPPIPPPPLPPPPAPPAPPSPGHAMAAPPAPPAPPVSPDGDDDNDDDDNV